LGGQRLYNIYMSDGDIQMEGRSEAHKPRWAIIIVLIAIVLLVALFWSGAKTPESAYTKAANAPAENPGLTGVSDEDRAAFEAARSAPAPKAQ